MSENKVFKIYTKSGDDGTSGLIGGTRVDKSDARLEAYGTIDELNSWIGLIINGVHKKGARQCLEFIQNKLFIIGSHLATDDTKSDLKKQLQCSDDDIAYLESEIDRMQNKLPQLNNFILPGGSIAASHSHIARTVCRRAERRISVVKNDNNIEKNIIIFVNRLSDYLFVLARYINNIEGISETKWESPKS